MIDEEKKDGDGKAFLDDDDAPPILMEKAERKIVDGNWVR